MHKKMQNSILLGTTSVHIDFESFEAPVHIDLKQPLQKLKDRALKAGFELCVASGYRSFDRQLAIWNNKALGRRPVLDSFGEVIDVASLSDTELMMAMLRWSAVPGASRHHWGTEIDIYDGSAIVDNADLQLTVEETQAGGIFEAFYMWLAQELLEDGYGFYRPYDQDRGGVAPEPWHLSFGPCAREYQEALNYDVLREQLEMSDIALKSSLLQHLPTIYKNYVVNVSK